MAVDTRTWLDVIEREYLRRFVPMGGSGIRFAVCEEATPEIVRDRLAGFATEHGFHFAHIDAASTRLHMIQDFFFAIARAIDWNGLAQHRVESMFRDLRYDWPNPGGVASLAEVAARNDVAESLIMRNVDQWLTRFVLNDRAMAQDFRQAMAHLIRRRLEQPGGDMALPIVDWLKGELPAISALRPVGIGAKISRYNARAMLRSLGHWLSISGSPGLIVSLDMRWIGETGPSTAGIRYTPSAVLDAFEVLRQLIDEMGRLENMFLMAAAGPSFLEGERRRTLDVYPALKNRIGFDVGARRLDNPLAPLIRLAEPDPSDRPVPVKAAGEVPFSAERSAIEALRAGVPNEAAIRILDGPNDAFTSGFVDDLRAMARTSLTPIHTGKIVAGGFGAGKSHLLGRLAEYAQNQNFIVSMVTISKETPLFRTEQVFAAAIRNAVVPDINDDVMSVAIGRLDPKSEGFIRLEEWANAPQTGLSAIFAALLHLLPRNVLAPEDRVSVARFLGGGRLGTAKIRQWLAAIGAKRLFDLKPMKAPQLALERLRFAPALFRAAGFSGWCVLIDEVELIGRYSTLQRAKSYAELSRWLSLHPDVSVPGVVSVAALVDDFKDVVLDGRLDQERVPTVLEARNLGELVAPSEAAMRTIETSVHTLAAPIPGALQSHLGVIRNLYAKSYGWTPPATEIGEVRAGKTMREYVKSWITDWDLQRLYGIKDEITTETMVTDYTENLDLESSSPDDSDN